MPRFHHVNLGVPPDVVESEADFLVSILNYQPLEIPPDMQQYNPRWFEADDGTQVHLSVDPDHRPAARAHTAIELSGQTAEVEGRLRAAGLEFQTAGTGDTRTLFCQDPAGNRWELRA
jgi:hypothetical protein